MRYVPFKDCEKFKSRSIFTAVLMQAPSGGVKIEEMRRRCRVMDRLEALPETALGVQLEDADHEFFAGLLRDFNFGVSHPDLLRIIDAVLEAKEAPAVMMPDAVPADPLQLNGAGTTH